MLQYHADTDLRTKVGKEVSWAVVSDIIQLLYTCAIPVVISMGVVEVL